MNFFIYWQESSGGGIFVKGEGNVNLTIDFGGHTYTLTDPAVGSSGTETQGFHLEKGNKVTLKNGIVRVSDSSINTKMIIQNYCNLTVDNVKLYGSGITEYVISSNYGDISLNNVTVDSEYTDSRIKGNCCT